MTYQQKISSSSVEKVARNRASKALRNARQRCTNKKNADYPSYGGCGIEVRFKGVADLVAHIGLPTPNESLDRINPLGHYEQGNVRWTSVSVQAANKKLSATNYHLSDAALISKAKDALEQQADRKGITVAWLMMLRAYCRGYLNQDEAISLGERISCPGALQANFDLNTVYDQANVEPGYIHLPALTLPGARVRLRAEPRDPRPGNDYLRRRQRLVGLEQVDHHWNVPEKIWQHTLEVIDGGTGLVLLGKATPELLLGGWIEGVCLALASAVPAETGRSASFFPMMKAIYELKELGSPSMWEDCAHPLLDDDVVLIPDFTLDCGPWGELATAPWNVCRLLEYRAEQGGKTIIGAPNLNSIPHVARNLVHGGFRHLYMPKQSPHATNDLMFSGSHWSIPENGFTFGMMASEPTMSHLMFGYD